jgi:hypothetical protein
MSLTKSEQSWKFQVAKKYFQPFHVLSDEKFIDLIVEPKAEGLFAPFLWAEVKKDVSDVPKMFAQLLLTIKPIYDKGEKNLPKYLGAFDNKKIVFVEFHHLWDILNSNPFNWKEKPSNVSKSNENIVAKYLTPDIINKFTFITDEKELKQFIKDNFTFDGDTVKLQITKNNFLHVYYRWEKEVRPTIAISNELLNDYYLIDGDFYLADLLSENNITIRKSLKVQLRKDFFQVADKRGDRLFHEIFQFTDGGEAHANFWNRYYRPPAKEYWNEMINRRELLAPQEFRERRGSFFTPQIWVEKSQEYLEKVFGIDWQDEYYIWDCCCGTGNLEVGLTNPYNVFASTLDKPDVDVMHELIDSGRNLLHPYVFQFDFLNDEFKPRSNGGKIPDNLFGIISNPEKRKKLIVYINPPYAEHGKRATIASGGKIRNKTGVALSTIKERYKNELGNAGRELFAQFFIRIIQELSGCSLASFSKLKYLSASNFKTFRKSFNAAYKRGFIVRANTFDNVNGHFPIGFLVWDLGQQIKYKKIVCDVIENDGSIVLPPKTFYTYKKSVKITDWLKTFKTQEYGTLRLGWLAKGRSDMQNKGLVRIQSTPMQFGQEVCEGNLVESCIFTAVHDVIEPTWLNDRDWFLQPIDGYQRDKKFQNDCLTFVLFNNRITSQDGINHWLPFRAKEVKAKANFQSDFMVQFLKDRKFSKEAEAVFEAGKALWTYYHQHDPPLNDASLYEIRAYFKGTKNGRVNSKSTDEKFTELDKALRDALKVLAEQIKPKVYEYGFLME